MREIGCQRLGRNALERIIAEPPARASADYNAFFGAHQPSPVQGGGPLAVAAARLNIFHKQHDASPPGGKRRRIDAAAVNDSLFFIIHDYAADFHIYFAKASGKGPPKAASPPMRPARMLPAPWKSPARRWTRPARPDSRPPGRTGEIVW